jgi:gluconate 2-dehydrogenase gamma chain
MRARMTQDPLSRRHFVGIMAGALAATWITGARRLQVSGIETGSLSGTLSAAQRRDLDGLTALIIPTDEDPGAREARIVDFIDRGLTSFAQDQRTLFEQGLADLESRAHRSGGRSFADLDPSSQLGLARELEAGKSEFFGAVRVATIAGFLANPEYGGNTAKVGWQLIGFEDRFGWQPPFGDYDREPSPG